MKRALHRFSEGRPQHTALRPRRAPSPCWCSAGGVWRRSCPVFPRSFPRPCCFSPRPKGTGTSPPGPRPASGRGKPLQGRREPTWSSSRRPPCPIWKGNTGPAPGRRGGAFWATPWAGCSPCGPRPRAEPFRRRGPCPASVVPRHGSKLTCLLLLLRRSPLPGGLEEFGGHPPAPWGFTCLPTPLKDERA